METPLLLPSSIWVVDKGKFITDLSTVLLTISDQTLGCGCRYRLEGLWNQGHGL